MTLAPSFGRGRALAAAVSSLVASVFVTVSPAAAQEALVQATVPVAPEVVSRMPDGRVTIRAIRLSEPLQLDGRLDEEIYQSTKAIDGFIQTLPDEGAPVSERTEAYVFFDDEYIYVSGRMWDSAPPDQWVANEMRRDTSQLRQNDVFGVLLDTFHDLRNGYNFYTNPLGARADQVVTDEGNPNLDWNPVWEARTGRFDGGWTVELGIPFKSIRYQQSAGQTWGIQIRRGIRRKNEWAHVTAVPASTGGAQGILRVSSGGTLVGLEPPPVSANIEIKPYAIAGISTDRLSTPAKDNEFDRDIGIDAKYGVTANLTADLTVNTDFAQVDVDEQQVNLTRFSLFFPEKREFFLEGQSNFNFGTTFGTARPGGDQNPIVFFSRQIGIANGLPVPIAGGGRVTGRIGAFNVGALSIRTRESDDADVDATTFSVVRVRRDVLQRSTIGMIATDRRYGGVDAASNQVIGADAAFRLFQDVEVNANYLRSRTTDVEGDGESYAGQFRYSGDLYGVEAARLKVGDAFQPGIGFVSRTGIVRNFGFLRYSPRPARFSSVRKLSWEATYDDIAGTTGGRQTLAANGTFRIQANSGDELSLAYTHNEDRPRATFTVAGAPIAPGDYQFGETKLSYILGPLRPLVGTASVGYGGFYGGTKTEVAYNGRVPVTSQLSFEPTLTLTWLDMPDAAYRAQVVSTRTIYTITPRMMTSALFQFSSTAGVLATNARFMWEYRPGSELFLVYSDGRDTEGRGFPDLLNRSFAIKMTRLFQF